MIAFILCCHGGSDCFEPYVSLHSTPEKAREHYAGLDSDGGEGGAYFIEQVWLDGPTKTAQVEAGSSRK